MAIKWTKAGEVSTARCTSPHPLLMKVQPKGDGRWVWTIWSGDTPNPAATGVASSFGAARAAADNYASRSGHS